MRRDGRDWHHNICWDGGAGQLHKFSAKVSGKQAGWCSVPVEPDFEMN